MPTLKAFWSYTRRDDLAEAGKITELAHRIAEEYEMQTGDSIELFIDRDNIKWGEAFQDVISSKLSEVAFFVPVLTPNYFQSEACKKELSQFLEKTKEYGQSGIIAPILYVDFRGTIAEKAEPSLIDECIKLNWIDWTHLRLEEISSPPCRKAIATMAKRLVETNKELDEVSNENALVASNPFKDEPGLLERMADMENTLPEMAETLHQIGIKSGNIGSIMESFAHKNFQGTQDSFARRLQLSRTLAIEINDPSEDLLETTSKYMTQMRVVDAGMQVFLPQLGASNLTADDKNELKPFAQSVIGFAESSRENKEELRQINEAVSAMNNLSRELKVPARRIEQAVRQISESIGITESWVQRMEDEGLFGAIGVDAPEWIFPTKDK